MNTRTWMSRLAALSLLAGLTSVGAGCVLTESSHRPKEQALPAPAAAVHQVHATWEGRVIKNQDITKNGAEILGLGGRMYLFGEEVGFPVIGDGMVIVELSDVAKLDPQGKPQMLERWEIDPATLKRLLRKDMIGWGYTLFLPWQTYRPDLTKIQMQVRFIPAKGLPLYSPPSVVNLRDDTRMTVTQRQVVPGQVTQAAANAPPAPAQPGAPPPAAVLPPLPPVR